MLEAKEVLDRLATSSSGLGEGEAQSRLQQYGPNELADPHSKSLSQILWEQAISAMVLMLGGAALVQALVAFYENEPREWIDVVAIVTIVVLNIALGVFLEYRAERTMAALKTISAPRARVRRIGKNYEIAARELVPGDILIVDSGNIVPADCRLLECVNLRLQEASLSGESFPVDKQVQVLNSLHLPLGDRTNMLLMGTSVLSGHGVGIVVETGMRTELGRIADLLQNSEGEKTPLQRRVQRLGMWLGVVALALVLALFALGVAQGRAPLQMFMASVAVAVAAIPEGLPVVLTITLALGAQRMLKRGALMRNLPVVETLGSVTTICTDKTGTLTENKMRAVTMNVAGVSVALDCASPDHNEENTTKCPLHAVHPPLSRDETILWVAGVLCNDASLQKSGADLQKSGDGTEAFTEQGDPTEVALLRGATPFKLLKPQLENSCPRIAEGPFSFQRKRMATVHRISEGGANAFGDNFWTEGALVLFVKGAPESVLQECRYHLDNGNVCPLDDPIRARICADNDAMARRGQRVLALAYRKVDAVPEKVEFLETDLVFVGLLGLLDPPRPEAREAVQKCQKAGIRPVMITGDHPLTALEIARQLKIAGRDAEATADAEAEAGNDTEAIAGKRDVLTGDELSLLSREELENVVERVPVYARVEPEQKLQIVQALQRRGHLVAMTGDGVNDAPTLRCANVGVAMGMTGSDVAKEAADMVLTDDNFATIVSAIEEGRTIYDNVRKFVKYIVASNSAEVAVMLLALLFGFPVPLTTLQILWINLVTDGVPALALGVEPPESNVMRRTPFPPQESLLARGLGLHIGVMGSVLAFSCLAVGLWAYSLWGTSGPWQTMLFATLTFSQLGYVLAVRSNRESLVRTRMRGNPLLLGAVLAGLLSQLCVTYFAPLQLVFSTQSLTPSQLMICLGASSVVVLAVELEKWLLRRREV